MTTHYDTLGVAPTATAEEIKRAWARLVRVHTPDKDPERNRLISEAKATLMDPKARAAYDVGLSYGEEIAELQELVDEAMGEKDWPEAVAQLREILALHPGDTHARNKYALCLFYMKRWVEARAAFERLLKDAPDVALYHANYGHMLMTSAKAGTSFGRLDEAEEQLRRAIALEPHNAEHHRSLSELFIARRRFDKAELALEAALKADGKEDASDIDTFVALIELCWHEKVPSRAKEIGRRIAVALDDEGERLFVVNRLLVEGLEWAEETTEYRLANSFVEAAREITPRLGEREEVAAYIRRFYDLEAEADALREDKNIHPPVLAVYLAGVIHGRIGFKLPESYLDELFQALRTWDVDDLKPAGRQIQANYPAVYQEMGEFFDKLRIEPRSSPSAVTPSPVASNAGGGCCLLVLPAGFGLILALALFTI